MTIPQVRVGAADIMSISEAGVLDHVTQAWRRGAGGSIVTVNVDILHAVARRPELAALIHDGELVVADGMPVVWAARIAGADIPERVTGSSLIYTLTERAAAEGRSIFLLGGDAEDGPVAAAALAERYPGLKVAGHLSPPFGFETTPETMRQVIDQVVAAAPDLVWVALGFPKQEKVIGMLRPHLPAAWYVGCGGSIAMVAGRLPRASETMQKMGAEWVHRLRLEPRRMARRYLKDDAPYALLLLARAAVTRLRGRR